MRIYPEIWIAIANAAMLAWMKEVETEIEIRRLPIR